MDVRYNSVIPSILLALGAVNFVLAVWLLMLGGSPGVSVVVGPVVVALAVMQWMRPYFEFDPHTRTIAVKALIGPVRREFGGAKGGTLHADGDRVYWTKPDGRVKKVPVHRFLARADQWRAVLAQIG